MDLMQLAGLPFLPDSFPLPLDRPFTYQLARAQGLRQRELTWLTAEGFLRRPIKSVYVDSRLPDTIDLRCACLRLVVPPDAVVCDRHAGWLAGATMVLEPGEHLALAPISMYLPAGRRLRNDLADSGERRLRPEDVMEIGGLRVTTPVRTAWDLGRDRWVDRSLAAVDQMLRLGAFSPAELAAGLPRFKGMRWVTVLRAVVPLADGRAESPPESVLRLRWIEANVPAPTPQLDVWAQGRFLARLDLGNPELRFGAEYDGDEWHSTPEQIAHDRVRRAAVRDEGGFHVVALRKEQVFGPAQCAERLIREGAAEARRRFGSL
ncbi:hypothetical protein [Nocardioides sp. L-11A]|uniref:hypothetical protein n=1 Tax=Nocardioides sp. L-11A TaxID=3043848 RepID=UPI00249A98F8|nr:hypothetical protein QJ852_13380 [Nocardioides sp. L-11A]